MDILTTLFHPLEAEAKRENSLNRGVRDSRAVSLSRYFASINGNFYITGDSNGMDQYRRQAILSSLVHHEGIKNAPTIILSNDDQLKENLISNAVEGKLRRRLLVKSEEYADYHFFYGMEKKHVLRCISDVAQERGIVNPDFDIYAEAFVNVVDHSFPVSLPAILNLMKYTNEEIVNHAAKSGLSNDAFSLRSAESASDAFRSVIQSIYKSVFELMNNKDVDTEFTIRKAINKNDVVLIHNSFDSDILRICMAYELYQCRGCQFNIIVDGVNFISNTDPLWKTIQTVSSSYNNVLAFTSRDVINMLPSGRLNGLENHIILKCSSENVASQYLSLDGYYRHAYVDLGPKGDSVISYAQKLRIEPMEMRFAVLKGHLGNTIENTYDLTD